MRRCCCISAGPLAEIKFSASESMRGLVRNLRFGAEAAEERGRQTGGLRMEGTGLSEAISEFWAAVIS